MSSECGASCLLNGASCLLNVGRVVLGRVFFGASCLGASCLWGELSVIRLVNLHGVSQLTVARDKPYSPFQGGTSDLVLCACLLVLVSVSALFHLLCV